MVPGGNLLNLALSVIGSQSIQYYQFTGRSINAIGQYVSNYADPITVETSFQPLAKNLYTEYGLDLTRTYYMLYAPVNIVGVDRDVAGDQIVFNGLRYQCEAIAPWFVMDGWTGVLCCLTTLSL